MAEGADPAQFQKPPYDPVPPPNPYAGYGEAPEAEGPAGVGGPRLSALARAAVGAPPPSIVEASGRAGAGGPPRRGR